MSHITHKRVTSHTHDWVTNCLNRITHTRRHRYPGKTQTKKISYKSVLMVSTNKCVTNRLYPTWHMNKDRCECIDETQWPVVILKTSACSQMYYVKWLLSWLLRNCTRQPSLRELQTRLEAQMAEEETTIVRLGGGCERESKRERECERERERGVCVRERKTIVRLGDVSFVFGFACQYTCAWAWAWAWAWVWVWAWA